MCRLLVLAIMLGLFIATGGGPAAAQTVTSCSDVKHRCLTGCGRSYRSNVMRNLPVDGCMRVCSRRHTMCMGTGEWRGRFHRVGLRRA